MVLWILPVFFPNFLSTCFTVVSRLFFLPPFSRFDFWGLLDDDGKHLCLTLWNVHDLATIPTNISQTVWAGSNFFFFLTNRISFKLPGSWGQHNILVLWQVEINVKHLGVLIAERLCGESLVPCLRTYQQNLSPGRDCHNVEGVWFLGSLLLHVPHMRLPWFTSQGHVGTLPYFPTLEDKPKPL